MLIGIGTDIIEIQRVAKAIEQTTSFEEKIFTDRERSEWLEAGKKSERAAGSFAAKEAVSKALGTGFRGFGPRDVEIIRDNKGKPEVKLHDGALTCAHALGVKHIMLSISHCQTYAVAMVTMEG